MSVRAGERAAVEILEYMDTEQAYMGQALSEVLHRKNLTGADRGTAVAFSKLTVENRQAVDFALMQLTKLNKAGRTVKNILRLGAARILFGNNTEAQAVHASVELCKAFGKGAQGKFVNAVLRNLARQKDQIPWPEEQNDPMGFYSVRYSWPKFAVEQAFSLLWAEQACAFLKYRAPQPTTVRINPSKTTREEIEAIFKAGGITAKNMWADPRAYALEGAENIPAMEAYRQGKISLQGLASMVAANQAALNGGIILDVCAAPGGKSCNIAEQCPEAKVYAFDLHPHRVALISAQAERLGLPNVIAAQHDATQPFEEFEGIADCVLVDAPCTGLGTACHRPDVKWNKKQEDAAALAKLQRQILQNASRSVKPGGKLIYCTCTFTQTENEDVVGWFLANNAAFHLTPLTLPKNMPGHSDEKSGMLRLWPQIHQTDGFFICAMEKIS